MSPKILRPFIAKVSVLGYFPLRRHAYKCVLVYLYKHVYRNINYQ